MGTRTGFQRAIAIAGGILVFGVLFVVLATPYVPGMLLIFGALLILALGLYFCVQALGLLKLLTAEKRNTSAPMQEQF